MGRGPQQLTAAAMTMTAPAGSLGRRAEADAPVTAADIEDAAEAAEEAPVVEAAEAAEEKPKRKSKKDATPLDQLVVGDSYDGTITGVAAYGAFVDIGAQSDGFHNRRGTGLKAAGWPRVCCT